MKRKFGASRIARIFSPCLIALLMVLMLVTPAAAATPPTVTSSNATGVSYTQATFGGNVTNLGGASSVTIRGFKWGTSSGVFTKDWHQHGTYAAVGFTRTITGLKAGTTYYYKAYATNTAGRTLGNEVSFTTTAYSAPTMVTNAATLLGKTYATLNGAISATGGLSSKQRGFQWGTASGNYTGEYAYSWTQTALLSGWGTCSFSHKIKGLTTGTKYYFRSRAYNGTSKITPSLGVSAGGQAIWSSVTSHSSPYSVRLTAPTSSDYARVQVPYVVDFGNFTAPSFWYSISDGSARTAENLGATWPIYVKYEATVDRGYLSPYFVIQIGNGVTDHWIISQPWASQTVKNKKWVEWSNSQRSNGYTEALWHDEVFTDPSLGGGIPAGWGPLSYFTNLYNSYNTTVVKVGFGNFDVVGKVMAYVDDISLAGNMIDLNKANTRIQRWGYGEEFSFTTP